MPSERVRSRRSSEGSVTSYTTKTGTRWRYQVRVPVNPAVEDGPTKLVGKAGFSDENAATTAMLAALEARDAGNATPSGGAPTVAAYARQWHATLSPDDYAGATLASYRRILDLHVVPYLGTIRLDKLTPSRIAQHYIELRAHGRRDKGHEGEPLGVNSVSHVRVVLTAMLTAAVDDGWIKTNPAKHRTALRAAPKPSKVRAAKPDMVTWDAATLHAFLVWNRDVYDDEMHALWRVISYTGMRRSEALALRWSDIDMRNCRISISQAVDTSRRDAVKSTKTDRPRVIDVDEQTLTILKAWKAARGALSLDLARRDAYVFGLLDGRLRHPTPVSKAWSIRVRRFAEYAQGEVAPVTLHGLRHSHASILLAAGEHPKIVQERLGHSTISVTIDIYSHVTPNMQRAATDRFTALLNGA